MRNKGGVVPERERECECVQKDHVTQIAVLLVRGNSDEREETTGVGNVGVSWRHPVLPVYSTT